MFHYSSIESPFTEIQEPLPQNILTIDSLIAWLEKKPKDEKYNYADGKSCLVYQYLTEAGMNVNHVTAGRFYTELPYMEGNPYPHSFNHIAYGNWDAEHTFGAALQRARGYDTLGAALRYELF